MSRDEESLIQWEARSIVGHFECTRVTPNRKRDVESRGEARRALGERARQLASAVHVRDAWVQGGSVRLSPRNGQRMWVRECATQRLKERKSERRLKRECRGLLWVSLFARSLRAWLEQCTVVQTFSFGWTSERERVLVFFPWWREFVYVERKRETVYISENEREKKRICVGLRKKEKEFWHLCPW